MAEVSKVKRYLIPAAILVVAAAGAMLLALSRPQPPMASTPALIPLVETIRVFPDTHQLRMTAYGTVVPVREIPLIPQVSGRIVWINPRFMPGGVVDSGEILVVIDSSDYLVAVEEARAALSEARARLRQEEGQQRVARQEWELFSSEMDSADANRSLALRRPQLQSARAGVQGAAARLQRARLNLRRARIHAPFNGFLRRDDADVGQLVSAQAPVGTLAGTDRFRVRVALPEDKIPFLSIPGVNAEQGSVVRIRHEVGGHVIVRQGSIEKLLGDLAPEGRMAQLLVSIPDPLALREVADTQAFLPLLLNAYVEVTIDGPRMPGLYAIPRGAVRNGDELFVCCPDSSLSIISPRIVWRGKDTVFIDKGIQPGNHVITSPLPSPVEGMRVRHR